MVVISAAVCTKNGKTLVARTFVEMSRVRLEGLLTAFPKLHSAVSNSDSQHTFLETDAVRYVYLPLEGLYLLLITTKNSNIMEDLDTLHLFGKLVPEYCKVLNEEEVLRNVFQLIFAFDEVIQLGYKEKASQLQIRTFLEMDSEQERQHEHAEANRIREAQEEAKRKQHAIQKAREAQMRAAAAGGGAYRGFGSDHNLHSSGGMGSMGSDHGSSGMAGRGAGHHVSPVSGSGSSQQASRASQQAAAAEGPKKAGLVLKKAGATNKNDNLMKLLEQEGEISPQSSTTTAQASSAAAIQSSNSNQSATHFPVNIQIEEKLTIVVKSDGGVESFNVKGEFMLTVNDSNSARLILQLSDLDHKSFHFKTHPHVNKNTFMSSSILELKDKSKAYPVNTGLKILVWNFESKDESNIPFTLNCWPSAAPNNTTAVNVEYDVPNKKFEFRDVRIAIPIPGGNAPVVQEIGQGSHMYNKSTKVLTWSIPLIDKSNQNGSMELLLPGNIPSQNFFPITISFSSQQTFCDVSVLDVAAFNNDDDPMPIKYAITQEMTTASYTIV